MNSDLPLWTFQISLNEQNKMVEQNLVLADTASFNVKCPRFDTVQNDVAHFIPANMLFVYQTPCTDD